MMKGLTAFPVVSLFAAAEPSSLMFDLSLWSIVVFLLLMTVLWLTARKPLAGAMKMREQGIVESLEQAERALAEIKAIRRDHDKQRQAHKSEAAALVKAAAGDAQRLAEQLRGHAKVEADRIANRVQRELNLEQQGALGEIWQTAADASANLAQRLVRRELTPDDHQRLIADAIGQLQQSVEGRS